MPPCEIPRLSVNVTFFQRSPRVRTIPGLDNKKAHIYIIPAYGDAVAACCLGLNKSPDAQYLPFGELSYRQEPAGSAPARNFRSSSLKFAGISGRPPGVFARANASSGLLYPGASLAYPWLPGYYIRTYREPRRLKFGAVRVIYAYVAAGGSLVFFCIITVVRKFHMALGGYSHYAEWWASRLDGFGRDATGRFKGDFMLEKWAL